jgi:hypothetical protein
MAWAMRHLERRPLLDSEVTGEGEEVLVVTVVEFLGGPAVSCPFDTHSLNSQFTIRAGNQKSTSVKRWNRVPPADLTMRDPPSGKMICNGFESPLKL